MTADDHEGIINDRKGKRRLRLEQARPEGWSAERRAVLEALVAGEPERALARAAFVGRVSHRSIYTTSALALLGDSRASLESAIAGVELRGSPAETVLLLTALMDRLNYLGRYEKVVEIGRRAFDVLPYHPVMASNYLVALANQPERTARKVLRAELDRLRLVQGDAGFRDPALAALVAADPDHALLAEIVSVRPSSPVVGVAHA